MKRDGDPQIGKVVPFTEIHTTEGFNDRGTEYAQLMAEHTIEACLRLGLPPEFVPMFERQLSDLHFVVFDETQTDSPKPALLDVRKIPNGNVEEELGYKRLMLVSEQEVERRAHLLSEIFEGVSLDDINEAKTREIAVDWIFYEMAIATLSVACFMQQNFPNYIADWNGTNKYDNAHRTISSNYLSLHPDEEITAKEDTKRLIKGFGIMMMATALIAKGLVGKAVHAEWATKAVRELYPEAYRSEDIEKRLSAIKPSRDLRSQVAAFAMSVYDPSIDLDKPD